MADAKISALPAATTPLAGTEVLPIVQSATTDKVSVANLTAGRAVSAASLTLTTTPLAAGSGGTGASAAFTANGIAFASSTSVLATGSALTFDGTNFLTTGRATAASFVPSGSTVPTNGMYLSAANTLAWAANSAFQMSVTGLTLTVGAGASSPQLTLSGGNGANVGPYIRFSRGGATVNYIGSDVAINGGGGSGNELSIQTTAAVDIYVKPGGTLRTTFTATGMLNAGGGCFGRGAPVTKTGDFTLAATENWVIVNQAGTTTVTLPAASSWTGREVMFKTIQAQTLISASSNVVPQAGGAAGTAILAGVAGQWATCVSDGTNWIIMQGGGLL